MRSRLTRKTSDTIAALTMAKKDLPTTRPGHWYFFAVCANCRKDIIFQEAPSPGQEERPKVKGARLVCPHCQTEHTYRADEVERGLMD